MSRSPTFGESVIASVEGRMGPEHAKVLAETLHGAQQQDAPPTLQSATVRYSLTLAVRALPSEVSLEERASAALVLALRSLTDARGLEVETMTIDAPGKPGPIVGEVRVIAPESAAIDVAYEVGRRERAALPSWADRWMAAEREIDRLRATDIDKLARIQDLIDRGNASVAAACAREKLHEENDRLRADVERLTRDRDEFAAGLRQAGSMIDRAHVPPAPSIRNVAVEALRCNGPGCGRIGLSVDGTRITDHKCAGSWTVVAEGRAEVFANEPPPAPVSFSTPEPSNTGERWGISADPKPERWDGAYKSREAAIEAGRVEFVSLPFYVQRGTKPAASSFTPSAESIIEGMSDAAGDECGEAAEEFPDVAQKAGDELDAFLDAWADKHCEVRFWIADNSEPERIEPS